MGIEFDILAWYHLLVFLLSGFLPVWGLLIIPSVIFPRSNFIKLLRDHYPKALPISNFFFIVSQLAGGLIKPGYFTNILPEIISNPFFLLLSIVSLSLLALLFYPPGKRFNRLVLIAGLLITCFFIAEQLWAGRGFEWAGIWTFGQRCLKSSGWFLFLGSLILVSELVRNRTPKK